MTARAFAAGQVARQALLIGPDLLLAAVVRRVVAVLVARNAFADHAPLLRAAGEAVRGPGTDVEAGRAVVGIVRQVDLAAVGMVPVAVLPAVDTAVEHALAVVAAGRLRVGQ